MKNRDAWFAMAIDAVDEAAATLAALTEPPWVDPLVSDVSEERNRLRELAEKLRVKKDAQ